METARVHGQIHGGGTSGGMEKGEGGTSGGTWALFFFYVNYTDYQQLKGNGTLTWVPSPPREYSLTREEEVRGLYSFATTLSY